MDTTTPSSMKSNVSWSYRNNLPNKQQSRVSSSSDDDEDPFANLPKPVPVPIRTGSQVPIGQVRNAKQLSRISTFAPSFGESQQSHQSFGGSSHESENFKRTFSLRAPSGRNRTFQGQASSGVQASLGNVMESSSSAGLPNNFGITGETMEYNRYNPNQSNLGIGSQYSGGYTEQSSRNSLFPVQRQSSLTPVENIRDLNKLGKFDCLPHDSQKFQMVTKYVNNSSGLNDPLGRVTVHDVYEINRNDWMSYLKSICSLAEPGSQQHLLWFKTSSKAVQRLAQQNDGCVAFYDRLCRALPENPNNMQGPFRQLMILCAVSLGRVYESPHGFQHWSFKGNVPHGFGTIKGMGMCVPDWKENFGDDSVVVPFGKTTKNIKFQSYNLDFNEYIVFESRRIKVKYVVDVEIKPAAIRRQMAFESQI